MRVDFYHLTRDPAPQALALIAGKALQGGQRMFVVCEDDAARTALSDAMWATPGFLANGEVGQPGADMQPVLLSPEMTVPINGARLVALADGIWRDDALEFDRAFLFFDASTIDGARGAWRALGERDNVERRYWKQADGRWVEGP